MIKWIISDMDGTLLVEPNKLPDDFDEIMDLLKQHNIMFHLLADANIKHLFPNFLNIKMIYFLFLKMGLMSANMIKKFFLLHYQILLYKKLLLNYEITKSRNCIKR